MSDNPNLIGNLHLFMIWLDNDLIGIITDTKIRKRPKYSKLKIPPMFKRILTGKKRHDCPHYPYCLEVACDPPAFMPGWPELFVYDFVCSLCHSQPKPDRKMYAEAENDRNTADRLKAELVAWPIEGFAVKPPLPADLVRTIQSRQKSVHKMPAPAPGTRKRLPIIDPDFIVKIGDFSYPLSAASWNIAWEKACRLASQIIGMDVFLMVRKADNNYEKHPVIL